RPIATGQMNRRRFLKHTSAAIGGMVTSATIGALSAHSTRAANHARHTPRGIQTDMPYGELERRRDQNGVEVLALPKGFEYVTFGKSGQIMSDGFVTPRNHDGMTCFAAGKDIVRLIRNHEIGKQRGRSRLDLTGPESTRYDRKGTGGCVTIDFDIRRKRLVRDFISLNGTIVNCAGGLAYRDAGWLSCEEIVYGPERGFEKPHGFTFFVPKDADRPLPAEPIIAMGRFKKEAAVADSTSGIVYQTEDDENESGFYRFVPRDPVDLMAGGVLQMLTVSDFPNYDTRYKQVVGAQLRTEWVTIDDPHPETVSAATSCFSQGYRKGGARFKRLEGAYRGEAGSIYFVSTNGGDAGRGQLWQFIPRDTKSGTLQLIYESPDSDMLDSPDNICATPNGGLIICEDDASHDGDTYPLARGIPNVNRLIALGQDGIPSVFAVNIQNNTELAGACFSPDGEILFVNVFGNEIPGSSLTCAIWGPWSNGPL
ncbi:MAG: DUF839 domain-containing protein, partial [Burkholderiales bacterium]